VMKPADALAAIPETVPQHNRDYPRIGTVRVVDQVECLKRARMLIDASFAEIALGHIEGDWLAGADDLIEMAIERIEERVAELEAEAEAEREIDR